MNAPVAHAPRRMGHAIDLLAATLPVPGAGLLAVNSFVLHGSEPVLVDTGLGALREDYLDSLAEVIDPADLRWIWITHTDADHVGNLEAVLARAPRARVVTNFLGMGKLGLWGLPTDRVHLLNPGQTLEAGDRSLLAVVPPTYDAPETCGLYDAVSGTLFSADSFGALLHTPVEDADAVDRSALREGMIAWTAVDAPWVVGLDPTHLRSAFARLRSLDVRCVMSSHLPPMHGGLDFLIETLSEATRAEPFVGPDQAALEAMMAAGPTP
jgi:flavorubredoxin